MKKRIIHILSSAAFVSAMLITPAALYAQSGDGDGAVIVGDDTAPTDELPATGATPEATPEATTPDTGIAPSNVNLTQGLSVFTVGASAGAALGGAYVLIKRQQASRN